MGENSKIQWTGHSWNPWQGCIKISPGCKFCYMYRDKEKYGQDPKDIHRSTDPTFFKPLSWKEPALVFTCSWSDWFIEQADNWRSDAYGVIKKTPHLTYQILTKRADRIAPNLPEDWGAGYDNAWIGVSIEEQDYVNRIVYFRDFKAKVKFLSVEPLIGPVDLKLTTDFEGLVNWVIIGGESGNDNGQYKYRPCRLEWIEDVVNQCYKAGIPVFVKQLGTHLAKEMGLKDRHGGDINEWPEWLKIRQMPISTEPI